MSGWRLAVDIGGTFTDVVLANGQTWFTHKRLTTYADPATAVLAGIQSVLAASGVRGAELEVVLHGTTLATNALIERRGARTTLLTTAGHRDVLAIGLENRFDQYDIFMQRPEPLVPAERRIAVQERVGARGEVLVPLTDDAVEAAVRAVLASGAQSVAIGLLHAWINPVHELQLAAALARRAPGLPVSLSARVCPEIREFERLSTTVANAYVQPQVAAYLESLAAGLRSAGITAQLLVMTSGGGLTSVQTAQAYPVRLVESGPAGGAMLAAALSRRSQLSRALAFDMGGTTAKLTLIDAGEPEWSRTFEVARAWKFRKGSGMPVRIPVIELVEIGAGGGSIASVDPLGRIQVGPESAASEPGPAAYDRGGRQPTVTDADLVLGKIIPRRFAGGTITLHIDKAEAALRAAVADRLHTDVATAAQGIIDTVDENMAAAARNHAGEWGRDFDGRTLIAFGGAAPLHAAALARRLGIGTVLVPVHAGVGSAVGFLLAPVAYEVVRSRHAFLEELDVDDLRALLAQMRAEARAVVVPLVGAAPLRESLRAWMRYVGQGYEIPVQLASEGGDVTASLRAGFDAAYAGTYGRLIPGQRLEILSWTLSVSGKAPELPANGAGRGPDVARRQVAGAPLIERASLAPGQVISGPVLVVEDETTTVVPQGWTVCTDDHGQLILQFE